MQNTSSTPKRRKLGAERILRPNNHENINFLANCSPINFESQFMNTPKRCDSPHLPCNQVEYLSESNNTNIRSTTEIPCSPGVVNSSVIRDIENWESLVVSNITNRLCNKDSPKILAIQEIDDISDDMFYSKLEQSNYMNNQSKVEKEFKKSIDQSFNKINESIHKLSEPKKCDKSSLFETKDSFLLNIKESSIVMADNKTRNKEYINANIEKSVDSNEGFYGLPVITKSLFKTYRNIEKFYEWQEDCLKLDAIKQRKNLIYALPTSGGKTLVAEVLMLREVIVRKRNALFILPFVAIVQEKIWSLSPFAIKLDFLVEEYAGGKGHIPPKKRRRKNSIYMATIEKGLALIRSLIELDRLNEIGLIVVDELHLIGEKGRGGTLETLLSTVIFTNQNIQIIGMSATIGNLPQLASFLRADVFHRHFRPVQLDEYVKLGDMLYRIHTEKGLEIVPHKQLTYEYSSNEIRLDPDRLGGLVWAGGEGACLVFCPTKRNCENVAALLCTMHTGLIAERIVRERALLQSALRGEGASVELCRFVRYGVAYHHAGLAADERSLLEQAFRSGVISVICCTSTLAAGVNLPASRVLVRAPRVGRDFISLASYRQMAGRAGRAGCTNTGESIIICNATEWPQLQSVLSGGIAAANSVLADSVDGLILSAVSLRLATTRAKLWDLLGTTLLAITHSREHSSPVDIKSLCDTSLQSLLRSGALEVLNEKPRKENDSKSGSENCYVYKDSLLAVSKLGKAAIKGCMDLSTAKQLLKDLEVASRSLVLMGSLHLLYLVTPHDAAGIKPDYRHYYSLYCNLDDEGVQTAKILGITEMNAIRMMTGKSITNVPEKVICRFYLALMLHDLWKQVSFAAVADKYSIPRGTVQSVMTSAAAFASSAQKFCEEIEALWAFRALFGELAPRLQHCAAPELHHLMELPSVRKTRALQLVRAGYKRIEDLAKASADDLTASISYLSRTAADHLISAARMMLIEKVENLRAEAEDVMEQLNVT